ncbi:MAG: polymerase, sigma-24 subunit, subfamily [Marmoricola sp.]|nr:polymerase, sigma-24 subunit, subfamily [Marmoricola sp.]
MLDAALEQARNGEEAGFVELWKALHPPLLRYLAVGRNESPEDLAAEAWLQVVRDLASFRGNARDFRGFLFTVARNRAVDQGRARAARPVTLVAEPAGDAEVPSAETIALERDATRSALELVATLPPEQAEMVMLRVVAGLDVAVVAKIVGKKPGTVRVSVHRSLRALRSLSRDLQPPDLHVRANQQHEEVV